MVEDKVKEGIIAIKRAENVKKVINRRESNFQPSEWEVLARKGEIKKSVRCSGSVDIDRLQP